MCSSNNWRSLELIGFGADAAAAAAADPSSDVGFIRWRICSSVLKTVEAKNEKRFETFLSQNENRCRTDFALISFGAKTFDRCDNLSSDNSFIQLTKRRPWPMPVMHQPIWSLHTSCTTCHYLKIWVLLHFSSCKTVETKTDRKMVELRFWKLL